jgi:predicted transcriptional regulator
MSKKLFELTAEIVQAQASAGAMSPDEIETFLTRTFNILQQIQRAEEEGKSLPEGGAGFEAFGKGGVGEPADLLSSLRKDPLSSIQEDKIICLECGAEFRQLTANHLKTHGLTPREYKKNWGFPLKQPLAAKALTRTRSRSAKKRGLPVELQQYQEKKRKEKMEAETKEKSAKS